MRLLLVLALLVSVGAVRAQGGPELRLTRSPGRLRNSAVGPEPIQGEALPAWTPDQALQQQGAPAAEPAGADVSGSSTAADGGDGEIDSLSKARVTPVMPTSMLRPATAAVPGEFIVLFEDSVAEPEAMARVMQAEVRRVVTRNGERNPGGESAYSPYAILRASPAAPAADGYVFPVKTATIKVDARAPGEVVAALQAQPGVQGVFPNTLYAKQQQVACAPPSYLGGFKPFARMKWDGCLTADRELVWYGERCGADLLSIQWTGVYAAAKRDGKPVAGCSTHFSSPSYRPGTAWGDAVFGRCGVAPTAASLPTRICPDPGTCVAAASLPSVLTAGTVTACGYTSSVVAYAGARCGPNGAFIRWTSFSLKHPSTGRLGCTTRPQGTTNPMFDRSWFGACGSPPANFGGLPTEVCGASAPTPTPTPTPTPPPSPPPNPPPSPPPVPPPSPPATPPPPGGTRMFRVPLKQGERDLPGMSRIQAVVGGKVPEYTGPIVVAVLDTGGTALSDLNTQKGISFVGGSANSDWSDSDKHGTHVAGTVGGRNNGGGVHGALPGVRVLPVKVLGNDGYGSMSDIMAAIDYVTTNAPTLNVGVINLSLGGTGSASDPICRSIDAAVKRGIIVVVAAGNDGSDLAGFSPASCAAAISVTAINPSSDAPASFSNWLNANLGSGPEQRRVVAAPGVSILSTLPNGGYDSWQGTSMACPHVAGVAARCFAAADCELAAGGANREKLLDRIWSKYESDPSYRWNKGKAPSVNGKFYGPLVWADEWRYVAVQASAKSDNRITKQQLKETVKAATGLTMADTTKAVDAVLNAIIDGVAAGKDVAIPGFGTFKPRERPARTGRNPKTGAALQIAAKTSPVFTAGRGFKDAVAGGGGGSSSD
ncbi:MAG: hypothetical protein J3K34DRAFT_458287 [Monoraphidium minutum]|nr:MAG: hypothetical protein J3K34DRAFT_458287 [Monoraphidium minutum]